MNLTLTFATKYNGVALNIDNDDIKITDDMWTMLDKVGDTFPEYTGDWADNWEHSLTDEQIAKLCKMAEDVVRPVIPNPKVTFEYDRYSS